MRPIRVIRVIRVIRGYNSDMDETMRNSGWALAGVRVKTLTLRLDQGWQVVFYGCARIRAGLSICDISRVTVCTFISKAGVTSSGPAAKYPLLMDIENSRVADLGSVVTAVNVTRVPSFSLPDPVSAI